MFPPPQPWKTLIAIDPEKQYLAFTSRFAMRSVFRVPAFMRYSFQIMRQVEAAPGAVGYALGADLLRLNFYTLSVWEDEEHLRAFVRARPHIGAMRDFRHDMRSQSPFIRWNIRGAELPPTWKDALSRQTQGPDASAPNIRR